MCVGRQVYFSSLPPTSAVSLYFDERQPSRWMVSQRMEVEVEFGPSLSPISMSEEKCLYLDRAIMGPSLLVVWKVRSGLPGVIWEFST